MSIVGSIIGSKIARISGSITKPAGVSSLLFRAPLKTSLDATGVGDTRYKFARTTFKNVIDHDNVYRSLKVREAGFYKARRVNNLLSGPSNSATTVVGASEVVSGRSYRCSATCVTAGTFQITFGAGTPPPAIAATAGQRVALDVFVSNNVFIFFACTGGTATDWQIEEVNGASNDAPNSYVEKYIGVGPQLATNLDEWVAPAGVVIDSGAGTITYNATHAPSAVVKVRHEAGVDYIPYDFDYELIFTISGRTAGSISPKIGGVAIGSLSSNSTYTRTFPAVNGTGNITFTTDATSNFNGTISNISIRSMSHGSGCSGVKCFNTTNGNSVVSNLLVEAEGTIIPEADIFGYVDDDTKENEILHNRDTGNAAWLPLNGGVTRTGGQVGPDGNPTAYRWNQIDGVTDLQYQVVSTVLANTAYAFSVYIKNVNAGQSQIGVYDANNVAYFGGTISTITWSGATPSTNLGTVKEYGNGWWRLEVTSTTGAVVTDHWPLCIPESLTSSTQGILITDFQMEKGTHASAPIITGASSVTRTGDYLRYPHALSVEDAAGTILATVSSFWSTANGVNRIVDWGPTNAIMYCDSSPTVLKSWDGTATATVTGASWKNTPVDLAVSWGDNLTAYYNAGSGTPVAYDGSWNGTTGLAIGVRTTNTHHWDGTIKNVSIYSTEGATL